jgi:hemolysin-activating ACP:hemolysin acyltransferase
LTAWIEVANELELLQVYYQDHGYPVGYLVWAFLERDVQERLLNKPNTRLHISEWTEGREPWILDFAALKGNQRAILRHAARSLFGEYEYIHYVRRDAAGLVRCLRRLTNRYWEGAAP